MSAEAAARLRALRQDLEQLHVTIAMRNEIGRARELRQLRALRMMIGHLMIAEGIAMELALGPALIT